MQTKSDALAMVKAYNLPTLVSFAREKIDAVLVVYLPELCLFRAVRTPCKVKAYFRLQ